MNPYSVISLVALVIGIWALKRTWVRVTRAVAAASMIGQASLKVGKRGHGKGYTDLWAIRWLLENTARCVVTDTPMKSQHVERFRAHLRKRKKFRGLLESRLRLLDEKEAREWWRFTVSRDFEFDQSDSVRRVAQKPLLAEVLERAAKLGIPVTDATLFFDHYELQGWVSSAGRRIVSWEPRLIKWAMDKGIALRGETEMPTVQEMHMGKSVADVCRLQAKCGPPTTYVITELAYSLGRTELLAHPERRLVFEEWNKMARHFGATMLLSTQYLDQLDDDVVKQADTFNLCRQPSKEFMSVGVITGIRKPKLNKGRFVIQTFSSVKPIRDYIDDARVSTDAAEKWYNFEQELADCYMSRSLMDEDNPFARGEQESVNAGKSPLWAFAEPTAYVVGFVLAMTFGPRLVVAGINKLTGSAMGGVSGHPSTTPPPFVARPALPEITIPPPAPSAPASVKTNPPLVVTEKAQRVPAQESKLFPVVPLLPINKRGDDWQPPDWQRKKIQKAIEEGAFSKPQETK